MIIKKCKFCNKELEFKNTQSFGAHIINCDLNPNKKNRYEKIAIKKTIQKNKYDLHCINCNNLYSLMLKITDYDKNKYRKTCSSHCAHSKQHSIKTKQKIADSLRGREVPINKRYFRGITYEERQCKVCKNKFSIECWKIQSLCSKECRRINASLNKVGKKNPMFGKVPTHKNYQGGYFHSNKINKIIHYRSSYELKALEILENDSFVIGFKYESIRIPYNNKSRNTIPDFIVTYADNSIKMIEVKCKALLNRFNNKIKINAMKKYCKKNNIIFELWMEKELKISR